jgi:hypothetical protein
MPNAASLGERPERVEVTTHPIVIPAQAGIQLERGTNASKKSWMPAFAGMTKILLRMRP